MATNLLDLPLKKTARVNVRQPLELIISDQYAQYVGDFDEDIRGLEELRNGVLDVPIDSHGLRKLTNYYVQLSYLATKLPNDIGAEFTWYSISNPLISEMFDDLSFEKANVLFNIASMYANLGICENRSTVDGLKRAHQQFQLAAGCFKTLTAYIETASFVRTGDLQPDFLGCLIQAMLAQAQECIWQKAVIDHMKDKLVAQLSQEVSKLYDLSVKSLEKSTAMSPSWVHHLTIKSLHFAAAAQVRMSSFSMASNQYGEEVARLRLASELCRRASKHMPYVASAVSKDLSGLTAHVESNKSRAEKDNDMIYVIPVPTQETLVPIVPQVMVRPMLVPEIDSPLASVQHQDMLFHRLVPFVVRHVTEIFEQRKDEIVSKEIVNKYHALNLEMQGLLQDLGLPASLSVLEQPLGLPGSLKVQAEEVRVKGGSKYLEELLDEVATLAAANTELVEQIVDLMDLDSLNDDSQGQQGIDRLSGFRQQLSQYEVFLTQAKSSDNTVQAKVEEWKSNIDLLADDQDTLSRSIPEGTRITLSRDNETAARKVRLLLNRWDLLFTERKCHVEEARNYAEMDDIRPELIEYGRTFEAENPGKAILADDFEDILSRRLAKYSTRTSVIPESAASQTKLAQEIQVANNAFVTSRSTTRSSSQREKVLQDLDTAYHKYREIINNLEEGSKFYNDFHKALCRVSDEVKTAIGKLQENRAREERELVAKTKQLRLDGETTIVSPASQVQAGTWHPEHGIAFASSAKPATRSSTRAAASGSRAEQLRTATPKDATFDPSRHTIQFGAR